MNLVLNTLENWYDVEKLSQVTASLGNIGFGKSYAGHKMCEINLDNGWPFAGVDPKGIYYGLRAFYDNVVLIGGDHQDVDFEEIDKVLPKMMENNISFVLDFKQHSIEHMQEFLAEIFRYFINWHKKNRKVRQYILEECDYYIGQNGVDSHTKKLMIEAITKCRSDGMGFVLISQRFRLIDKTPLGQANNYLLFNMKQGLDLTLVKKLTGEDFSVRLKHLERGKCLIFDGKDDTSVYKIPEIKSKHPANTPVFGRPLEEFEIKPLNEEIAKLIGIKK